MAAIRYLHRSFLDVNNYNWTMNIIQYYIMILFAIAVAYMFEILTITFWNDFSRYFLLWLFVSKILLHIFSD